MRTQKRAWWAWPLWLLDQYLRFDGASSTLGSIIGWRPGSAVLGAVGLLWVTGTHTVLSVSGGIAVAIVGAAFVLCATTVLRRIMGIKSERPTQVGSRNRLGYLTDRDSELSAAIQEMARKSAWGKWFSARHIVSSGQPITEQTLLQIASHLVLEKLVDGDLVVRGRPPTTANYGVIERTDWRLLALFFVPDQGSIWKMVVTPRGASVFDPATGVKSHTIEPRIDHILQCDSFIVDSAEFEGLWPRVEGRTDRERARILRRARGAKLDPTEIKRLS